MAGVHEDFGEKIGGAKKDLWKDRGLYADDLEAMNEREAEKFVKKDNVWKKPDYAAMLEEGIPLGVVYFIKKARDGLNASPQYYRTDDTPEKRTAPFSSSICWAITASGAAIPSFRTTGWTCPPVR